MDSIPDPIHTAATSWPDAPAIIAPEGTVTFADLDRRVSTTANRLRTHGVTPKARLAIYQPASVDTIIAIFAALRLGVAVCPISTRHPSAAVLGLLPQIGPDLLIITRSNLGDSVDTLDLDTSADGSSRASLTAWSLMKPTTLVFTSGSTGGPKLALHRLGNYVASAHGSIDFFDLQPGDRWLLSLPLYHVGGLAVLFRCVLSGAAIVLPKHGASLEAVVAEHDVTHASLVATQLLRVLRDGETEALAGMKALLLGGSAIPTGLLTEAHALGLPVHTSYGMTEMTSTVTATPSAASRDALSTSGVVLPNREVQITDDGEVLVRGATLFAGYVDGKHVISPIDAEGWFHTGDLGEWIEVDGHPMLRVTGRKDNLFISGGENVQPEEIEAALGRIEGVRQAIIVPVPDEEFGQRPVAFVDAGAWQPEAWRSALGVSLARFKIPAAFYPWPEDAQAGIKVSRAALRARAENERSA